MNTKNIYRPQSFDFSSYIYLIPALFFYILFVLFPLGDTFYTSFTEWSGIGEKKWVGFEQYTKNLSDKKTFNSLAVVNSNLDVIEFYNKNNKTSRQ